MWCRKPLRTIFINWLIKRTDFMVNVEDAMQLARETKDIVTIQSETATAMDLKLDEIRAYILGLGLPNTDLTPLVALLTETKTIAAEGAAKVTAALEELDQLDEPATP